MKPETAKALHELGKAVAKMHGYEGEIEMTVCNRENEVPENYDDDETWLCSCGNFIEDGIHCGFCNCQPPWGCPCNFCEDGDEEDYDDELSYSDVMREDW